MVVLFVNTLMQNTMAEQNFPAQAPTRTDEQILPRSTWLQIGKSNLLFDAQKIQKNLIFQISIDILRNTNFFRAFSASVSVFAIYIQQFWNTMKYDEKTGVYCCQVDEQWFNLSADLLRKALDITLVDPAHPFELPPTGDMVIDFVNQLGYLEPVEFVSNIRVNYVYLPWRAILSLINQCLIGKTSGNDKPRHPEEFTQGIETFFSHKASLKDPKKKVVPLLIPYGRFTKMIIYYLGSTSNVHRRTESPRHLPRDDFLIGNLKFIPKGETYEVFGMAIPKPLITEAIQQSSYYPKYLEMHAPPKKLTPVKPTKPAPVRQIKPPSSKQPKSPKKKPSQITPSRKVHKGKPSLVDEEDEAHQVPEPQGEERAIKLSLDPSFLPQRQVPVRGVAIREHVAEEIQRLPDVEGKGKDILTEEEAAHSLIDLSKKKNDTSEKVVPESSSTTDLERIESGTEATAPKVDKELGEVTSTTVTSGVGISFSTEDQAGSDPGKEHVALVGPNLEHMDEDFYATSYPKVHENLKLKTDERVILENPEMTTLVFNISSPKPFSLVNAPPINTEATTIITTLQEITPFIALQLRVAKLEQDVSKVKKTSHSAAVLASIQSQVPTVVDKYLGTKVDDALLKALEKHTLILIQKYSGLPAPESSKKQESEKSPEEILIIKREQEEQKHVPTYTIKSTDTAALKEFDLKVALFKTIHENKSANRNPANNRLYHALIEALIEDENAMEKEVANKVKGHKRKHDSDDDEDDDSSWIKPG
ncbi:hypothetical protein Tco_1380786 [Tanacetum coccineum]